MMLDAPEAGLAGQNLGQGPPPAPASVLVRPPDRTGDSKIADSGSEAPKALPEETLGKFRKMISASQPVPLTTTGNPEANPNTTTEAL
jgi:hypothetical protein